MSSIRTRSRLAGLLYLGVALTAPVRLVVVPSLLVVAGDPVATVRNLAAHEGLFRFAMACDVLSGSLLLFTAFALYRLFEGVDRHLALLMLLLGGVLPPALTFFNLLNDAGALALARGAAAFTAGLGEAQRVALAGLFLHLHHQVIVVAETFWGLWLFPLGALTIRSRFLPRILGWWLYLNGAAYLALCFVGLLAPAWEDRLSNLAFAVLFGEIAFVLWLTVRGARPTAGQDGPEQG